MKRYMYIKQNNQEIPKFGRILVVRHINTHHCKFMPR